MPVTVQAQPSAAASTLKKSAPQKINQTSTQKQADSMGASRPAAVDNDKVCWIEVKRYPYKPDHQVELLHLQAEADALIIKLQAMGYQQGPAH